MGRTVTIVDTGSGNLRSVARAFEAAGASAIISADPAAVRAADKLVVPGQGAFGSFVDAVKQTGMDGAIHDFIATGRPYFGICLGMQILFEDSEEQGPVAGLALLPGHVVRFQPGESGLKVPHIGWNHVRHHGPVDPLLRDIPDETAYYFVHSYYVVPADPAMTALTCTYGAPFCAAIRRDNLFAVQFHPEKSQGAGLRLIENYVNQ